MIYIYYVWLLFFNLFSKFNKFFERIFFLLDYPNFYKTNSLSKTSYIQMAVLILFYTPFNFVKVTIFYINVDLIYNYRLYNYTMIHNFFAKNENLTLPYIIKTKYIHSCIKSNNHEKCTSLLEFTNCIIITNLIYIARYSCYWKASFLSDTSTTNYLNSQLTYVIFNNNSIKGFIQFLSKDFDQIVQNRIKKKDIFYENYIRNSRIKPTLSNARTFKNDYDKILKRYEKFFKKVFKNEDGILPNLKLLIIFLKTSKIILQPSFKEFYKIVYPIKYKPTDTSYLLNSKKSSILFLRKNKIFNKGRYSRNRQLYRTGVYWCLWLNIINVFGLYYYFYRFVFNFGYFYIPLMLLILSLFGSRLIKYRFYNPTVVIHEFNSFLVLCNQFYYEILKNFAIRTAFVTKKLIIRLYKYILYIFNF